MNDDSLIKDLRCLRMRLNPILSEQYKEVLREAEKRLSGGESFPSAKPLKKVIARRLSKKELMAKFDRLGF